MTDQQPKEFRVSGSSTILDYIRHFSATEKAIFGVFVIAAAISALVMTASANNYFTTDVPAYAGTLREGLVGLPHTVNPILAITDVDRDISALVYAGLTRYENGEIVPDLAASWSTSTDGLTYEFTLRENLSFHDGKPLTADDIIFTIQKIQDPALKSPRIADWVGVTATATAPLSVRLTLRQPYNAFLSNTSIGIIPKHIWESVSDDQFMFSEYNIRPIGAGPYRVGKVDRDQDGVATTYELKAWNGYHGDRPHISKIAFSFFADESHALSALESGEIDSLPAVSAIEAVELAKNSGEPYKIVSSPLTRIFGVFFNQNNNAVLAELAVRRALEMSVDRKAIIDAALLGYGTPLYGPLPPGVLPSNSTAVSTASSTASSTSSQADIIGAQALLEKNGWKMDAESGVYTKKVGKEPTKTLTISLYTADAPEFKQAAELIKKSWTALGAQVDLKVFEPNNLYQNIIRTRTYDALLFGEAIGRDNDLYAFWHSSQRNAPGLNVSMYVNSKADRILENIRTTTNADSRLSLYEDLEETIIADMPAVFLYAPEFVYAVPKTLRGAELGEIVATSDRWNGITDWYIETDRVWKIFSDN